VITIENWGYQPECSSLITGRIFILAGTWFNLETLQAKLTEGKIGGAVLLPRVAQGCTGRLWCLLVLDSNSSSAL
jgi:hypothetical protein